MKSLMKSFKLAVLQLLTGRRLLYLIYLRDFQTRRLHPFYTHFTQIVTIPFYIVSHPFYTNC